MKEFGGQSKLIMSGKKKTQKQNANSMKEELLKWICIKHATNSPLDRNILRDKADELVKHFQLTEFKCSESWLTVFLKRYGFSSTFTEQCGPILDDYQEWTLMIRGLINQYRYEDQYHMDELSMYTDFIPSSKLKPDELPDDPVDMSSLKLQLTTPAMNKITLLLVCNASGTEKLKPIVCGPYSLTENEKYSYFNDEKSVITDEIIGAWLFSLNHEMSKCNRSILLFMSRKRINALKLVHLTHILPVFFPNHFPSDLKPLRRDIFHYLKMFYRKLYIEKLCLPIASPNWQARDIADMLVEAWKQLPRDLIISRFQRVKFREDDSFLSIECTEWDNLNTGVPFKRFVTFDDDLGETSGQICDDLRFLTRIKHEYNLKTLEIQDSIEEAGSSGNFDSPKRPDDDFVDERNDCEGIPSPATPISNVEAGDEKREEEINDSASNNSMEVDAVPLNESSDASDEAETIIIENNNNEEKGFESTEDSKQEKTISSENINNSLSVNVTETLIDEEIQLTARDNSETSDFKSNLNNSELKNVDNIVNSVIKSSELNEIVDKTEISSNSEIIENSIDLSLEMSEKIDDSSMDTLTNESTSEFQKNYDKISGVYQTLDKTISYDTESALQEASRELEEKLRDLEANDLCKKKEGFYCDDNSESSKNSIETVSILRELLDEAREFNDNDEFKGYDNKYIIDEQNCSNLKRKRESSESEDCDKSESKKIMLQDNWAKCFEKFPVFGPYHIYQDKKEENNEENCAQSGPSGSNEK